MLESGLYNFKTFIKYKDQDFSFIDCTSFLYMKENKTYPSSQEPMSYKQQNYLYIKVIRTNIH